MSNSHSSAKAISIRNPGPYEAPISLALVLVVLVMVGVTAFLGGLRAAPDRAWASFLSNHFYFMSLGLGGLFFAAIQWLTGAMWSAPVRRMSEAFTAYLPVALFLFVVLIFGLHDLYHWSDPLHVKGDLILEHKAGYLNVPFFVVRNVLALLLWIFFAWKIVGNSVKQDATGEAVFTARNRVLSPVFLFFFAITFTMVSFDLLMSLDPHWFSTMFGVYCFAGLFYSNLAATCLLVVILRARGKLGEIVNENHLHDLGKFMFAFTVFWAYIGFSQFMLIWYANLPEETGYFIRRLHGGWFAVSVFLLVGKFFTPFIFLLPRAAKRNPKVLATVAVFMLLAQWIDVLWMVQPEFLREGPAVGWIELGMAGGFLGIFGLTVLAFLRRFSIVAVGDPKLPQAVFQHHQ